MSTLHRHPLSEQLDANLPHLAVTADCFIDIFNGKRANLIFSIISKLLITRYRRTASPAFASSDHYNRIDHRNHKLYINIGAISTQVGYIS